MKKLSSIFLFILCLTLSTYSQKGGDTAQIVIPDRVNAEKMREKPYVILISVDGMRYDYMERYHEEDLLGFAKKGIWAPDGIYPVYPSATFPNHYSIITGLLPAHHGIVDNVFYDPARDEKYIIGTKTNRDGSWYRGKPVWTLAEEQEMLAASLFWVGSESDAGGTRPSYYYKYHEKFSDDDKVGIIKDWLTLPEEKRPHFITLYFPEVDHAGHRYGPVSPETHRAMDFINGAIKKLEERLDSLDLPINYIVVSDHGMIEVTEKDFIKIPYIDREKYVTINSGCYARITAKDEKDIEPLYERLKRKKQDDYEVYLASDVPEELHYSSHEDKTRRIGDILLIPNGVKLFVYPNSRPTPGKHGYSAHEVPEMKASFFAWGPAFETPQLVEPFNNIDIYPMIAEILGLEITTPIDGNPETLKQILKEK